MRQVAVNIAIASADASVRLSGHDGFPWGAVARALATLDPVGALAALARWEYEGTIGRVTMLSDMLHAAITRKYLSPAAVVAMAPLLNDFPVDLVKTVVSRLEDKPALMPAVPVVEMLARDELLRFGEGRRDEVYAVLSSRASIRSQHQWLAALGDATAFHKIPRPNQADGERKASADASLIGAAAPDVMDRVDWANRRFITTEEIAEVLATTIEDARRTGSYALRVRCFRRWQFSSRQAIALRTSPRSLLSQIGQTSVSIARARLRIVSRSGGH